MRTYVGVSTFCSRGRDVGNRERATVSAEQPGRVYAPRYHRQGHVSSRNLRAPCTAPFYSFRSYASLAVSAGKLPPLWVLLFGTLVSLRLGGSNYNSRSKKELSVNPRRIHNTVLWHGEIENIGKLFPLKGAKPELRFRHSRGFNRGGNGCRVRLRQ